MARTVMTSELIEKINNLYLEIGSYAGVSRALGGAPSATTVKKYIIPNFTPTKNLVIKKFDKEITIEPNYSIFKNVDNWGTLCELSEEEKNEIKELWKEMAI